MKLFAFGLAILLALLVNGVAPRVTVCHAGQTIEVSQMGSAAHLRHGDTLGACPVRDFYPRDQRIIEGPDPIGGGR